MSEEDGVEFADAMFGEMFAGGLAKALADVDEDVASEVGLLVRELGDEGGRRIIIEDAHERRGVSALVFPVPRSATSTALSVRLRQTSNRRHLPRCPCPIPLSECNLSQIQRVPSGADQGRHLPVPRSITSILASIPRVIRPFSFLLVRSL